MKRSPLRRKVPGTTAEVSRKWAAVVCRTGRCAKCGKRGPLHPHHIIYRRHTAFRNHPLNGIPLCFDCHVGGPDAAHRRPKAFKKWLWATMPETMKVLDGMCPEARLSKDMP